MDAEESTHFPAEYFEWEKVENPAWEHLSRAQQLAMMGIAASPTALQPKDYPVDYDRDEDGHLRVTITLPELRPRKLWVSEDHDVVLVLRDTDLDAVDGDLHGDCLPTRCPL